MGPSKSLHDHTHNNKELIAKSTKCGCCYCCAIFPAVDVTEYVDKKGTTALCPLCSIDAVIPDCVGTITVPILEYLYRQWFSPENGITIQEMRKRIGKADVHQDRPIQDI